MIVDLRTYTVVPGKLADYVKLYEDHAWPIQQRYLGRCLGWYTTAEGDLNRVVHMWAYDSQADREARRGAMAADSEWQAFLKISAEKDYLLNQENKMLKPTSFSPVK